jgi:hypothetical protein
MSTVAPDSSSPSLLMSALHHSRCHDAARIIHRHRHLVADGESGSSAPPGAIETSACAPPATNDGEIRMFRKLSPNFMMALVLLGFGVAHVVAVAALQRAAISHEKHAALAQGD